MAEIYPAYEAELRKRNALDFESLIFETHRLFTQFPAFAKRYRTVYRYICIDEFQDTNEAQYSLVRALTGNLQKNLFIVADDDQIIYQWNGASHRRIETFVKDFSPQIIQLPMNYRCPPEVVALANNLISHNFLRTTSKKPLEAFRGTSGEEIVRLLPLFADFAHEAESVANDISQHHGIELEKVTVLARTRKLLVGVQEALQQKGMSAVIAQRKSDFESTPFMWLHAILRLANDRQSRSSLEVVCGAFAQLARIEIDPDEVIVFAKAGNGDYLQQWIKLVRQKELPSNVAEVMEETSRYLGEARDFKSFSTFALKWFQTLAETPREATANDPMVERFARYEEERVVWNELYREIMESIGPEPTLEAFLQELQMRSKEPAPNPGAVVLMTIHSAKGKEFDHVYLIGLVEDELPSFQSKQKGDRSLEMEEERRNCFVAITRAKKTLTLSYAQRYRGWPKEPSRFLFEMGLLSKS